MFASNTQSPKMNKNFDFAFTTPPIPEGEAITFAELEEHLLKQLKAKDGTCKQALINLADLYSHSDRLDEACRCIERLIELSDDLETHAGAVRFYREALGLEPFRSDVWYWIHHSLGHLRSSGVGSAIAGSL